MYHVHVYNVQPGDCPVQHRMATVCHQEPTACDKMVQSMYTVVFFLAAGHSVKALQKLLYSQVGVQLQGYTVKQPCY